ncbi:hypothetical protein [Bradyrhizobium sp.]|nr:hypothetical protein [Bradyrhizobium sp.]
MNRRSTATGDPSNPYESGSLVPMLIAGLVLTLVGMVVALTMS